MDPSESSPTPVQRLLERTSTEEQDILAEREGMDREVLKEERDGAKKKPWWKTPSHRWLFVATMAQYIALGMLIAPKLDLFNGLVCIVHLPKSSSFILDYPHPPASSDLPPQPSLDERNSRVDVFASYLSPGSQNQSLSKPDGKLGTIELGGVVLDSLRCRKSPVVQAKAASFTALITITQGVLSIVTTGWWGKVSDRKGRTFVMAFAVAGLIVTDIVFLVTARFARQLSYRFLLLGPLIDGLLGGIPTLMAAQNAYISDSTSSGRTSVYSRLHGVQMLGIAIGPIFGTAIIKQTGRLLSVFYLSTGIHLSMFLLVLFIPESLSSEAQHALGHAQTQLSAQDTSRDQEDHRRRVEEGGSIWKRGFAFVRRTARRVVRLFKPLEVFLPRRSEETGKLQLNMLLLGVGQALILTLFGAFAIKNAYLQLKFGWGYDKVGPVLTLTGGLRALHLLLLLPLIIRVFKPRPSILNPSLNHSSPNSPPQLPPNASESLFDLRIIRYSILLELIAYLVILASQTSTEFVIGTALTSFATSHGPAITSLALALLPDASLAGELFAAMAVVQACCATVLGPLTFAFVYSSTTSYFPKAVFVLAFTVLSLAFLSFSRIRLDKPARTLEEQAILDSERIPLVRSSQDEQGLL
ncbi:major facilitator superfamily domain-containing protein [Mrakia frigida]|uniref:major facilitator superfamily domain-containing protein n=1 Tax=Mrakia frigida TaxID=29902 RepID=UPI003FCBFCAF